MLREAGDVSEDVVDQGNAAEASLSYASLALVTFGRE